MDGRNHIDQAVEQHGDIGIGDITAEQVFLAADGIRT